MDQCGHCGATCSAAVGQRRRFLEESLSTWLTRAETATTADRLEAGRHADGIAQQLTALPLFARPCTPIPPQVASAA